MWPGRPFPLGPTWDGSGTNFSLFSENARAVEVCLFDDEDREERIEVRERTAHNWHVYLPGVGPGQRYGYRVARAVGADGRPPLQPGEAPDRPVCEGGRGTDRVRPGPRPRLRTGPGGRDRRGGLRPGDPAVRRDRRFVRLGGRRAPGGRGRRRSSTSCTSRVSRSGCPACARISAARTPASRRMPLSVTCASSASAPSSCCRSTTSPTRTSSSSAGSRTTGATRRSGTSPPTRGTRRPARAASRCGSSRGW